MNKLSSLLGAAAVIAIAVVFIVQFQPANRTTKVDSGPKCAVEIRGSCISSDHFWAAYYLLSYRGMDQARSRSLGFRKQTAEGLIDQWVLNQDAKRLGITVSDSDVTAEIASGRAHISLPVEKMRDLGQMLGIGPDMVSPLYVKDRKTKKFDAKQAEKYIRQRTRLSTAEFRDYQKQELIAARMRELVKERVRVSESEAFEQFSRLKSTATLDFVRLDRRFFADLVLDTSPKAIESWALKNKEEIDKVWESRKSQFLPECRVTRHILVKVPEAGSEEEKGKARKKIDKIAERIKKGEEFSELSRKYSDDTSAARGGDLGCAAKGQMVKPFEDAMFALDEGKVSDVVPTEYGFHLIKVEKIAKDADAEKYAKKQIAQELYTSHESERLAVEGAKKLLEAVRGGKPMNDALKTYLDEVVPAKDKAKKADDKAKKADDKKADDKKADDKKADDKKADDKKADEELVENPKVTAENHPQRPTVESTLPFNVTGDPIQGIRRGTDITSIAFSLQKPGDVPNDLVPLENGYAVVQLKEKTPASKEEWEKNREGYMAELRAEKQQDALVAYIRRLRSILATEVKFPNTELITEPKPGKDDPKGEEMPGEE